MNNLKHIFLSIKSQIDHVANEFENHEALAGAAIEDLQGLASKTRLHLHRVSKMSEHYQTQLQAAQEQARLWSERAIKAKEDDEQKALQCVKRLRQTQKLMALLEQQGNDSLAQEQKIRHDLNAIQENLQVLKNKKEILAARQNRTGVKEALSVNQVNSLENVQNVFERWEGSVVSSEVDSPKQIETDNFAHSFEQEEDNLELKMILDELTKKTSSTDNK